MLYGMAALVSAILVWLNVFYQSDVIRVGNRVELIRECIGGQAYSHPSRKSPYITYYELMYHRIFSAHLPTFLRRPFYPLYLRILFHADHHADV